MSRRSPESAQPEPGVSGPTYPGDEGRPPDREPSDTTSEGSQTVYEFWQASGTPSPLGFPVTLALPGLLLGTGKNGSVSWPVVLRAGAAALPTAVPIAAPGEHSSAGVMSSTIASAAGATSSNMSATTRTMNTSALFIGLLPDSRSPTLCGLTRTVCPRCVPVKRGGGRVANVVNVTNEPSQVVCCPGTGRRNPDPIGVPSQLGQRRETLITPRSRCSPCRGSCTRCLQPRRRVPRGSR